MRAIEIAAPLRNPSWYWVITLTWPASRYSVAKKTDDAAATPIAVPTR